jgi:hypothetical protein
MTTQGNILTFGRGDIPRSDGRRLYNLCVIPTDPAFGEVCEYLSHDLE